MRTREEIQADWNSDAGPTRDKVNRLWLELFLDLRDFLGISIKSIPPDGAKIVGNLYVSSDGKLVIVYDDNPV